MITKVDVEKIKVDVEKIIGDHCSLFMSMFTKLMYDFCSHTKSSFISIVHEHEHETYV